MTREKDFDTSDGNSERVLSRLYPPLNPYSRFLYQTEIHLSDQGLKSVPDFFLKFHFVGLQVLDLSRNKLKELPDRFSNDRTLSLLDLSFNKLEVFPKWIANLIRLQCFDFSFNPISEESWKNLGVFDRLLGNNCRRLRWMIGQNCNFSATIPKEACCNKDLLSLIIGNNADPKAKIKNVIYRVPSSISDMKGLVELRIPNASVCILPESLGHLKSLQILDLRNNAIKILPQTFSQLTRLKVLNLTSNLLTELPYEIEKLANLQEVFLSQNQLSWIPQSSFKLKNLRVLDLYYNKIAADGLVMFHLLAQRLEGLDLGMNLVSKTFLEKTLKIKGYDKLEKRLREYFCFKDREQTQSSEEKEFDSLLCEYSTPSTLWTEPKIEEWENFHVSPSTCLKGSDRFRPSDNHLSPIFKSINQTYEVDGQFSDAEE